MQYIQNSQTAQSIKHKDCRYAFTIALFVHMLNAIYAVMYYFVFCNCFEKVCFLHITYFLL